MITVWENSGSVESDINIGTNGKGPHAKRWAELLNADVIFVSHDILRHQIFLDSDNHKNSTLLIGSQRLLMK